MKEEDNQHILDQIEHIQQIHITGSLDEMAVEVEVLSRSAQSLQHEEGILAALLFEGFLCGYRSELDKNEEKLNEVIARGSRMNLSNYCMRAHNSLGATFSKKADFYTSLSHYLEAYHISADHPEYKYDYVILNNIGNLFEWLDEYSTAATYLEQSYEKYQQMEVDDLPFLLNLIINLVDVYSYLEDYDKVQEWSENVPFSDIYDGEEVIECLTLMNRAVTTHRTQKHDHTVAIIEEFLEHSKKTSDYIYVFRCLIHLLKISLDLNNAPIIEKLIAHMDSMQTQTVLDSFDYQYAELQLEYYQRYLRTRHHLGDGYIDTYFEESQKTIAQLKRTYVNSLLVQLELDKSRLEAEKLRHDMRKDVFTNLYNKVSSEELVRESLGRITDNKLRVLILVDIDNFKTINDLFGHHFGDEIILRTANLLEENGFSHSIVGRFGGDEYMIFAEDVASEAEVEEHLYTLLERVHGTALPDNRIKQLGFSMGAYLFDTPISYEDAFAKADAALYRAKRQGRNQIVIAGSQRDDIVIKGSVQS